MCVVFFTDETAIEYLQSTILSLKQCIVVFDPYRHGMSLPSPFNGIPTLPHPEKEDRCSFLQRLGSPQLGIIFSYSRILWKELLDLFPLGVVNIHGGKLPEYRGANTLQWAIINGEPHTAATLHKVDTGVDTGPVIDERIIAIQPHDTALTLRDKLLESGLDLLVEWLPQLLFSAVEGTAQNEAKACVYPRRTPDDGQIIWSMNDEQISRLTRALVSPWPGAFYYDVNGAKVVIDQALSPSEVAKLRVEINS